MNCETFKTAGEALRDSDEISVLTAGNSMRPMLREHRDVVVIKRVDRPLKKGDVVLYPGKDKFILHRIVAQKSDRFIMRGDNNFFTENVKKTSVIGILKEFYRDGKYVNLKSAKYRLYTFYIMHSYPFRRLWRKALLPPLVKVKHALFGKPANRG